MTVAGEAEGTGRVEVPGWDVEVVVGLKTEGPSRPDLRSRLGPSCRKWLQDQGCLARQGGPEENVSSPALSEPSLGEPWDHGKLWWPEASSPW